MKQRLDQAMVARGLVSTRSQAEGYVRMGYVQVNGSVVTKAGFMVGDEHKIILTVAEQYVNRAALKLASVAKVLHLDFRGKTVLDVGSSTGGFTEYALRHGATKVIAVEVGTNQLHPSLQGNPAIELHEQTDIRDVKVANERRKNEEGLPSPFVLLHSPPDIVLADVSFISLREILPSIARLSNAATQIAVMVKPQFEAATSSFKHKGVIKNDKMRREILKDFEAWAQLRFVIVDKADSSVAGSKGNLERFYLLRLLAK